MGNTTKKDDEGFEGESGGGGRRRTTTMGEGSIGGSGTPASIRHRDTEG